MRSGAAMLPLPRPLAVSRLPLLALVSGAIFALPGMLQGQAPYPISPGDRVRIQAGTTIEGVVESVSPDTVVIRPYGPRSRAIAVSDIEGVHVRVPGSRGGSAGKGALWGGAVGLGAGIAAGTDCKNSWLFSAGECRMYTVMLFGGTGLLLGTVIGALAGGHDWELLEPTTPGTPRGLEIAPSADGGVRLGYRLTLPR